MSAADQEAMELFKALRLAREYHRAGSGSVLDGLLQQPGWTLARLTETLPTAAGVKVLEPVDRWQPDFSLLTPELTRDHGCVVLSDPGSPGSHVLAAEDPWDETLERCVVRAVGYCPPLAAVTRESMRRWLEPMDVNTDNTARPSATSPTSDSIAGGAVVEFVDQALAAGYAAGASDIHFECDRSGVAAKHRIDGVMLSFARLDGVQRATEVISRIKVLAQLDITERRVPQDGRMRAEIHSQSVDVRVSVMPSVHGEDVVLRLLDKSRLRRHETEVSLAVLGFATEAQHTIRELALQPSGLLLVTGPTGSGKTTTVYAALAEIRSGFEKIITIEDPVEYELPGVLQVPVNERKGLTFARGLRSLLRHDPDRILVGEIRDAETAEIAVQAALTGHLVFTTVHSNSVSDVVARFRHFGLDMFGLTSALNGVVVQRLVRRLCPVCSLERPPSSEERNWLAAQGLADVASVRNATGCSACLGSGYKGRFVIAEVHVIDDAWREHVTSERPLTNLRTLAAERGVRSLLKQAAEMVAFGQTTTEEIRRVVGWQP